MTENLRRIYTTERELSIGKAVQSFTRENFLRE